jgi:hypothetical protein
MKATSSDAVKPMRTPKTRGNGAPKLPTPKPRGPNPKMPTPKGRGKGS